MTEARVATAVSPALLPALLVCAAAPAFFVARIPWLGWVLLGVGLLVAWLIERRTAAASDAVVSMGARRESAKVIGIRRQPSLVRDLSLIALGLLIVSVIPLAAELDAALPCPDR